MAKDNGPSPDALQLLADGRVRLAWETFDVTLRRPKVKEWAGFLEEAEAADEWRTTDDKGEPRRRRYTELLADDGPYLTLYARIIEELGATTVARADLPLWMVDGKLIGDLSAHWLTLPLESSG